MLYLEAGWKSGPESHLMTPAVRLQEYLRIPSSSDGILWARTESVQDLIAGMIRSVESDFPLNVRFEVNHISGVSRDLLAFTSRQLETMV